MQFISKNHRIAISTAVLFFIVSVSGTGLAYDWKFPQDTQYNSSPDFDYKIVVYKWIGMNPEYVGNALYTYNGGDPQWQTYEWSYGPANWIVLGTVQGDLVYGEVWNKSTTGTIWYYQGQVDDPVWIP